MLQNILLEFNEPNLFHTVVCSGTDGTSTLDFNGDFEFSFALNPDRNGQYLFTLFEGHNNSCRIISFPNLFLTFRL